MSTNFPGPPHTMGFVGFFCAMGNWWKNPCIFHVIKYTTGWESNGKKAPILWEKFEYQFRRLSWHNGFCCIFPYYGKLMEKPMRFPYDDVYHRMRIRWEKSVHTMGKIWLPIFQIFPIQWVLLHFRFAMGNWWENPCISHMMKYFIGWESDGKEVPIL